MKWKVRFCVVGCGRAGAVHAQNLRYNIYSAELVALVDPVLEQAKKLAASLGINHVFSSLTEALSSVEFDAIVIATPTFTHAPLIVEAARAGKHIFTEKPLCVTLKESEQITETINQTKVKIQIGFMRRFDRNYLKAKELVDSGAIGAPILIKSTGRGPGLPPEWYCDIRKSNGLLAEVNSHDFDSMRWFMGKDFKTVYAVAGNYKCPEYAEKYPAFYDTAAVITTFEGGGIGVLDGCCPAKYGYDARMEILGTEGMLVIGFNPAYSLWVFDGDGQIISYEHSSWRTLFKEAYVEELRHFVDCILNDEKPKVGLEEGIKALEVVLAANLSISTGQPVEVGAVRKVIQK